MTASDRQRADIEAEVERLVESSGITRVGLHEKLLTYSLYEEGLPIDVRCPECLMILEVIPFPNSNGVTIRCICGTSNGTLRGL
jgi:hypothetical protein